MEGDAEELWVQLTDFYSYLSDEEKASMNFIRQWRIALQERTRTIMAIELSSLDAVWTLLCLEEFARIEKETDEMYSLCKHPLTYEYGLVGCWRRRCTDCWTSIEEGLVE